MANDPIQQTSDTRRTNEQAKQAKAQAESARKEVEDLENTVEKTASAGDPKKATTAQIITGEY